MIDDVSVLPSQDAVSSYWFEAAKQGKLLLQRDPVSGEPQFYPRSHIIGHPDRQPEWFEASGNGILHTYTVVKRSVHPQFASHTPFTLAIVDLEEGPRITSWIVDVSEDELHCDMPLKAVFREIHPGLTMPCFTKA